jgi:hypothetical protein
MSDTYGLTFYAPLGKWDHDSQSWKTSEATSLLALTLSSLTLPSWGGLQGGELFELPTPELATSEPASSSLPTPTTQPTTGNGHARNTNGAGSHGDGGSDLRTTIAMLPTPNAADGNGGGRGNSHGHQKTLPGTVRQALSPGATTAPPSPDGNTTSDDPHLPLLSQDGQAMLV